MGKFKTIAKIATKLFAAKKDAAIRSARSIAETRHKEEVTITFASGLSGDRLAIYHVEKSLLIANSHYFKRELKRDEHVDVISVMAVDTHDVFPLLVKYMNDHKIPWDGSMLIYICDLAIKLEVIELLYCCRHRLRHCTVIQLISYLQIAQEELNSMEISRPIVNNLAQKLSESQNLRQFFQLPSGLMLMVIKSPDVEPLLIPDFSSLIEAYIEVRQRKYKERISPVIIKTLRYLCEHLDKLRSTMLNVWQKIPDENFSPIKRCKEIFDEFQKSLDKLEKEAIMPRRLSVDSNVTILTNKPLKPNLEENQTQKTSTDKQESSTLKPPKAARRRASFDLGVQMPNTSLLTTCFETGSCTSLRSSGTSISVSSDSCNNDNSSSSLCSSESDVTSKSDSNFVLAATVNDTSRDTSNFTPRKPKPKPKPSIRSKARIIVDDKFDAPGAEEGSSDPPIIVVDEIK